MIDLASARWRKSSYSNAGGNCVEIAMWRKSSYSNGGGSCVEVAALTDGLVAARDSKAPANGVLVFPAAGMAGLIASCRAGGF